MAKSTKAKEFLATYIQPELSNPLPTLQPVEVNPFERIGPLPTKEYSPLNRPI